MRLFAQCAFIALCHVRHIVFISLAVRSSSFSLVRFCTSKLNEPERVARCDRWGTGRKALPHGQCDCWSSCSPGQFGRMIFDARNHPRISIDHVMDVCLVRRCEIENLPLMNERNRGKMIAERSIGIRSLVNEQLLGLFRMFLPRSFIGVLIDSHEEEEEDRGM